MMLLRTESRENPSIPMFYFTLDGDLPLSVFQEKVMQSVVQFARFRSVVRDGCFVDDGSFCIEDHVVEVTPEQLGGPPTEESLRRHLEHDFSTPLNPLRPMWKFSLMRNYRARGPESPVQTVVISRVHHVIVDGTAAMRILGAMSDESAAGLFDNEEAQKRSREAVANAIARARPACGTLGVGAGVLAVLCKYLTDTFRQEPQSVFRGPTTSGRSIAWRALELEPSMRTARAHKCTLNDLWMSAAAGAMGAYMRQRGQETSGLEITCGIPVSLHPPVLNEQIGHTQGNNFGFLTVRLPLFEFKSHEARLQARASSLWVHLWLVDGPLVPPLRP